MTKLLEKAVDVARNLPTDVQDDIARVIMLMASEDDSEVVILSPSERQAIAHSKQAAEHGEFATEDQLRALWNKYGL